MPSTASRPPSRAQSYAKTVAQTSRLLVNRQRQLLVSRQLEQLQSELAQLKTDESGLVAMARAKPDAEPEPNAELYMQMQHMAKVPVLAPIVSHHCAR